MSNTFTFHSWLGRKSFRRRYLLLTLLVCLLLVISAIAGKIYVESTSNKQIHNLQVRSVASDLTLDVTDQLRTLDAYFRRFIIQPIDENQEVLTRGFAYLETALRRLQHAEWTIGDSDVEQLLHEMLIDAAQLERMGERLIRERLQSNDWFPAMQLMQDKMLVYNNDMRTALSLVLDDGELHPTDAAALRSRELFVQLRHNQQRMVSEFRLYVANRFGIFANDAEQAMRVRADNVQLYAKQIREVLKQLEDRHNKQQLNFSQGEALDPLQASFSAWVNAYSEVDKILRSDDWRHDVVMLNSEIDPILKRLQDRLSILKLELDVGSARDITNLTHIAQQLSTFVIMLAGIGVLASLIGYVIFNRTLLRPIAEMAQALKAEAEGKPHVIIPSVTAEETLNLAESFYEMREQVKQREAHLDYLAHHDVLTRLPNRVLFRDRLEHAIAHAERQNTLLAVMFLDLDRFKQINDSLGHDFGDKLLVSVSERLQETLRKEDTISRLGGDEFAILVEGVEHIDEVTLIANKLLEILDHPYHIHGRDLHISASVGVVLSPLDDSDPDSLIKDADAAMYHAKSLGRNNFQYYSREMTARAKDSLELETILRSALVEKSFELFYQPIINLQTGQVYGCEALLRLQHPTRGLITPDEFIPMLDETGLIKSVTQWILRQVIDARLYLASEGHDELAISINLTGRLLQDKDFVRTFLNALQQSALRPEDLIIEITEDTLIHDFVAAEKTLRIFKDMGVKIALDDFGTGQSSLSHLRLLPIDIVKIDRDFVRDIPGDLHDSDLVKAVIAMAHSLNIMTVAEGVETLEQLRFLQRHNCLAIQGYWYSRPQPLHAISDIISQPLGYEQAGSPVVIKGPKAV